MNHPNDHDLAALRFQAAARDLEHIVRHIAERYIAQQVPLTWRWLHAIESEALADLGFASRHDAFLLVLFQRPDGLPYPETDDTADFGASNALPAVFAFAVSAYDKARNASSQPAAARAGAMRSRRARPWKG